MGLAIPVGSALPGDDVPSYPRQLRITLGVPNEADVTITWMAPVYVPDGGITEYEINGLVDGLWVPVATVDGGTYSYVHSDVLDVAAATNVVLYEILPHSEAGVGQRSTALGLEPPMTTSSTCNSIGVTIPAGGVPEVSGDMACLIDALANPLPDEVEPIVRYYFWKAWTWVNQN